MDACLVCPNCHVDATHEDANIGLNCFTCPRCKKPFKTLIVTVRAKRSRGSRKSQSREFDVRVYTCEGQEELIQFTAPGYDDFELRASDIAVFSYYKDRLSIVENLTIRRYMVVHRRGLGFVVWAIIILGILFVVALAAR